ARPNHAWQVDITYIRTRKGFAYLTALIDVYSRYIVGWALSNTRKRRYLGRYFAHPMMQNRRAKRDDYKPSAVRVTQRCVP
ncbi:DDE-type integrase/transposase/recombinase, partial [Piscirickettsia salmonis]